MIPRFAKKNVEKWIFHIVLKNWTCSHSLPEKALYVRKGKEKMCMDLQSICKANNNSTHYKPCSGLCLNKRLIMWTDRGLKQSPRSQFVVVVFVLLVFYMILKDLFKLYECHFPLLQMRDQNYYPIPFLSREKAN